MPIQSLDPATGEILQTHAEHTPEEVDASLAAAYDFQTSWRRRSLVERARPLRATADLLRNEVDRWARVMTREMGKPLREAHSEVEKCAWVCDYYAEHAASFLASETVRTDASKSFVAYRPLGVVLAVMPWNFPFWQVFRFAAPALMAGNTGVLKHASNVPGCALAIEEIFRTAGYPDGAFQTLLIGSDRVAEVIESPWVAAVTLTGSTPAGRAVASTAGRALKKTVLELGGSDPYVLLEDADLEAAVPACITGRMINSGQSCIAAKRFIVPRSRLGELEERVVAGMRAKRTGDPLDPAHDVGPLARHDLRDELHQQVLDSVASGARLLLGGDVPDSPGAYYPPTVLTDVTPGQPAYDDELFGPVAAILPAENDDDALRIANDTPFGLGAAVFTRDVEHGERLATEHLEAGSCFVNDFVRSDPRLPFGGVKASGYGRELGPFGIREFVNVKTVWVK